MRRILVLAAALILSVAGPSVAQEWIQYVSRADLFGVNFPSDPKVQNISYQTESGIMLPGRVYSVDSGQSHYSVTVVDYADAEKVHTARAEQCKKNGGEGDACQNDWRGDVQGSIVYATAQFLKRNAKVTHYGWTVVDQVEGHRLQLTNADRSRTYAVIHMHEYRLYILEGTVAPGLPPPALFQQSLGFLDKDGRRIRYATVYSHGYPPPSRAR